MKHDETVPHPYYGFQYRRTGPIGAAKGRPRGASPDTWKFPNDAYKTGEWSRYIQQRAQARFRQEGWDFEFEDWLKMWEKSGKQDSRGQTIDCYNMTRKDKALPWSKANCHIVSRIQQSRANGQAGKGVSRRRLEY